MPPLQASVQDVITVLSQLFDQGLSYSSINSAKSAVTSLISTCTDSSTLASSVLLQKFMKGVFNTRPALPKNTVTWDVDVLLKYLNTLSPPKALNLMSLSCKLATLLVLLSGQRGQSVHMLDLDDVECTPDKLILRFKSLLKQSRPGSHLEEIILPAYPQIGLCVVSTFAEYVKRTKGHRAQTDNKLFLTVIKPFKPISRDTLSRWVKLMLRRAGVDMGMFTPHSVRAASSSAAYTCKLPLQTILKTAGWSRESTFRRFYQKPIKRDSTFARSILHKHTVN